MIGKPKTNLAWIDGTCWNLLGDLKRPSSVVLSPLDLCILPQVAKSNPGNWFNMNPIHCLRSRCAAACSSFVQPAVCSVRGTCTSTTHLAFSIRWERPPAARWHAGITPASEFEERHRGTCRAHAGHMHSTCRAAAPQEHLLEPNPKLGLFYSAPEWNNARVLGLGCGDHSSV